MVGPSAELLAHKVNVAGILVLYQAFAPLLKKSAEPKFIPFTSGLGSLTEYIGMPAQLAAYGTSKAALNWITRRIHFENDWISKMSL